MSSNFVLKNVTLASGDTKDIQVSDGLIVAVGAGSSSGRDD